MWKVMHFFIMSYTCALFKRCSNRDQWFLCTGMSAANISRGIGANGNHQLHVRVNLHFHLGDLHFIFWLTALSGKKAFLHPRWTGRAAPTGLKTAFFCCCRMLASSTEMVETAILRKPFFHVPANCFTASLLAQCWGYTYEIGFLCDHNGGKREEN